MQFETVLAVDERGVVTGAHGVEAEFDRALQEGGELDLLVAAHARVRRASGLVLGDEVVDHVVAEALGEVPHVERDAEQVGGAARIEGVLDRAASAASRPQRSAYWESAKCTPTTSCPASTARAAATAESTPPLIAASIRMRPVYERAPVPDPDARR